VRRILLLSCGLVLIASAIGRAAGQESSIKAPLGCAVSEPVVPDDWLSYLRVQVSLLGMSYDNWMEMTRNTGVPLEQLTSTLTGLKTGVIISDCGAYQISKFENSHDSRLSRVALALRLAYQKLSSDQSTYLRKIVVDRVAKDDIKLADAVSTMDTQMDDFSVVIANSIGMSMLKLVDPNRTDAQGHCDHLTIARKQLDSLSVLVSAKFPNLPADMKKPERDQDFYSRAADLVANLYTKGYKCSDEP
jgi:hypothetical protein